MSRLNRYPHKLYKLVVTEGGENEWGQEESTSELVFVCNCYEQVMGESKELKVANGETKSFSSKIFTPIETDVTDGQIVEVREQDDTVRLKGEAKRNSGKDVKHGRLWV